MAVSESRRFEVTVIYRSGATFVTRCDEITVGRDRVSGQVTRVEWQNAEPEPLLTGVGEIAAVWSRDLRASEPSGVTALEAVS